MKFNGVFIKFSKKEFIESLYNEGLIYMNTFDFFKQCDNQEQFDPDENVTELWQADKCNLYIKNHKFSKESGLIDVKINAPTFTHSFCLFAIDFKNDIANQNFIYGENMHSLGDTMLIIYNVRLFIEKLNMALDKAYKSKSITLAKTKRVEYVDFSSYSGIVDAFRKNLQYKHQSEWRLAIQKESYNKPYVLKLGSLKDCSEISTVDKCKNKITFNEDGTYNIEL